MCSPKGLSGTQEVVDEVPTQVHSKSGDLGTMKRHQVSKQSALDGNKLGSTSQGPSNRRRRRSSSVMSHPQLDIRSRYYQKLGISGMVQRPGVKRPSPSSRPTPATLREPLKQDDGTVTTLNSSLSTVSISSSESLSPQRRSRSVSFDNSVEVRHIPMRKEYSNRIRKQLWPNRSEAHQSFQRNAVEFASENWDWRQAAEEKDMVLVQGNLVHPVHCVQRCNFQRQFFLVLSAQCTS